MRQLLSGSVLLIETRLRLCLGSFFVTLVPIVRPNPAREQAGGRTDAGAFAGIAGNRSEQRAARSSDGGSAEGSTRDIVRMF
jgi:hypothetical protein